MIRPDRSVGTAMLLAAMVFPTVLTFAYFVLLAGHSAWLQQVVYAVGKTIQFTFPALVVALPGMRRPSSGFRIATMRVLSWRLKSGWLRVQAPMLAVGVGFGLLVLAAMFGLYHLMWRAVPAFADATEAIRGKIVGLGISELWTYVAVGVFYALCHSALEEYYWRWFVFGQLRNRLRWTFAVAVSSLAFMAHHVILLATYFGWSSPWTYAFSLSVAVGGAVWAWLYQRSGSLAAPWLSHLVVDAAIFLVGYDLARDLLG
jgi:membrane protease YdiL (CAAX protease family)